MHGHGGTIDKFIGDGMMAFFGAPDQRENPAQDAFHAAKEMLRRLDGLNRELRSEGEEPLAIGVGLHLGEVVVGHVGSDDRHEYTAIGDVVNVASRLEGVTKKLAYPIACSEEVSQAVGDGGLENLGLQAIKGHKPITVHAWTPERNT